MILRARFVLPVSTAPIENGAVRISNGRIIEVGRWSELSRRTAKAARASTASSQKTSAAVDLGDVILLPGLVNAHCHLDYTDMAGQVPPQKSFTNWIKLITTAKACWSYSEFAASWLHGADMLVRTGTTTVGDIEAVPELLPEVWNATPLRVISFIEMTGVKARRDPRAILRQTLDCIEALPNGRCRAGLSPHAPYSTLPDLLRLCASAARQRRWRLCMHVAESDQEFEMFTRGCGEMFDWLRRNERDMADCGAVSPVQHLERCGLLSERLLAVHANYLTGKDAALLGRRNVSVVHCPRSHVYFGHRRFPLDQLIRARVNVCLGSDSLATVFKSRRQKVELNMFEEMRAFAAANPRRAPRAILRAATVNGARALGLSGKIGELRKGAFADVIAIPFDGKKADIYEAVLHHPGDVAAAMIDGQWAIGRDST
jgi:aminodeoxyfutalosine deaminase